MGCFWRDTKPASRYCSGCKSRKKWAAAFHVGSWTVCEQNSKENCLVTLQLRRNTILITDGMARTHFKVGGISTRAVYWKTQHLLPRRLGNIWLSRNQLWGLQRMLSWTLFAATASSLLDTSHHDSTQTLAAFPLSCLQRQLIKMFAEMPPPPLPPPHLRANKLKPWQMKYKQLSSPS